MGVFISTAFFGMLNLKVFLLMVFGCSVGIVFGAIPGLSALLGVTLLLPVSFGMAPVSGFALLISVWVGGVSGAFIASTLLGIPGSTASIATCYDAYPLAQKGKAVKALGAGIIGSFLGTLFSVIVATFLSPIIADLAVKLGPWEYFSLCFCAIILVVSLSKGDIFKGLASASIGLLLCSVGIAPIDGYKRFIFGNYNLMGGINIIALVMGLYAIRLIVNDFGKGGVETPNLDCLKEKGIGITLKELKENTVNIIRSFLIGLWIGFLPGMGAGLSNMIAYAQAKSSSKHPEKFGTGCVDGVLASEVANNASVGGAVIPMIALGIPGDSTTAILLGGLIIHGIEPGPLLFSHNPVFVYTVFLAIAFSSIITLLLQLFNIKRLPKILMTPYHYLYPGLLIICFVGAFTGTNTLFNCVMMLFMAGLGIFMDIFKLPISPLILSFILGPMLEINLRKGLTYTDQGFVAFLTRPVSAIFLLIAVLSLIIPEMKNRRKTNKV